MLSMSVAPALPPHRDPPAEEGMSMPVLTRGAHTALAMSHTAMRNTTEPVPADTAMNSGTLRPRIWGGAGEGLTEGVPVEEGEMVVVGVRDKEGVGLLEGVGGIAEGVEEAEAEEEGEGEEEVEKDALGVASAEALAEELEVAVAEEVAVEGAVIVGTAEDVGVMEKLFDAGRMVYTAVPGAPELQG